MKFPKFDNQNHGDSSVYLRLKDGESVNAVFVGELYEFKIKWVNNKSQVTGAGDPEGKRRYKCNVIVPEEGKGLVCKVWEFGALVCEQLSDINEVYPLGETKVRIMRKGTGTDTVYMLLPLLKEPLSPQQKSMIDSMKLNVLNPSPAPKNHAPGMESKGEDDGWNGF